MWHFETWFSGGLGSVRFTVELDDLKGLFQSKWFHDSMKIFHSSAGLVDTGGLDEGFFPPSVLLQWHLLGIKPQHLLWTHGKGRRHLPPSLPGTSNPSSLVLQQQLLQSYPCCPRVLPLSALSPGDSSQPEAELSPPLQQWECPGKQRGGPDPEDSGWKRAWMKAPAPFAAS